MGGYGVLRFMLVWFIMFGVVIMLSFVVYMLLLLFGLSVCEFGVFGCGDVFFVDEIYEVKGYLVLLFVFRGDDFLLCVFIVVGDVEYKNCDFVDVLYDIDMEVYLLFSCFSCEL